MAGSKWWAKVLRTLGIVFMGLTAVFTIMGGAGTSCVAFAAEKFGASMAPIVPFKWLYIIFVFVTLAIGVMGVRAVVYLIKRRPSGYRDSIIALVAGVVVGVIHIIVSRSLRGKSMPVDGVVYTTVITLILFLIFRIPAIWKEINFEKHNDKDTGRNSAALTMLLCGIAVLTAPVWGASTHTFEPGGMNWANAWPVQMGIIGAGLVLAGIGLAVVPVLSRTRAKKAAVQVSPAK